MSEPSSVLPQTNLNNVNEETMESKVDAQEDVEPIKVNKTISLETTDVPASGKSFQNPGKETELDIAIEPHNTPLSGEKSPSLCPP